MGGLAGTRKFIAELWVGPSIYKEENSKSEMENGQRQQSQKMAIIGAHPTGSKLIVSTLGLDPYMTNLHEDVREVQRMASNVNTLQTQLLVAGWEMMKLKSVDQPSGPVTSPPLVYPAHWNRKGRFSLYQQLKSLAKRVIHRRLMIEEDVQHFNS